MPLRPSASQSRSWFGISRMTPCERGIRNRRETFDRRRRSASLAEVETSEALGDGRAGGHGAPSMLRATDRTTWPAAAGRRHAPCPTAAVGVAAAYHPARHGLGAGATLSRSIAGSVPSPVLVAPCGSGRSDGSEREVSWRSQACLHHDRCVGLRDLEWCGVRVEILRHRVESGPRTPERNDRGAVGGPVARGNCIADDEERASGSGDAVCGRAGRRAGRGLAGTQHRRATDGRL
jgi:hypothetical protein